MHSIFRFGSELFVSMLVFVCLGMWIDDSFHTTPVFILAGVFYAFFGSFYRLYDRQRKYHE